MNSSASQQPAAGNAWERFTSARTSDAFCSAWLELVCPQADASLGVILIENNSGDSFVPLATWPDASEELSRLGAIVNKAIETRHIQIQAAPEPEGHTHVALPLILADKVRGAVAVETRTAATSKAAQTLHWGSAWLTELLSRHETEQALQARQRATGILETIATALRHQRFQQALFDLANDLRSRFHCSRVAIGLVQRQHVKLAALSEAASFEKSSPLAIACHDAMSESVDLGRSLHIHAQENTPAKTFRAHAALLQRTGATTLLSLPLQQHTDTVAVILLERSDGPAFTQEEQNWLQLFASFMAPVVVQRRKAERSSASRLLDEIRHLASLLVGPRHLIWKLAGVLAVAVTLTLALVPAHYRISAQAMIEGRVQRVVAAPFDGYLSASLVRAGDVVRKGDILARLDDHDLQVQRNKWISERDQDDNKLRQAMAEQDLSATRIANASLQEAQAQLDLVNDRLARVQIRAPYDGVIVSGDLSQKIGSPVEAGKQLFQIAPLHSYRIILQVDESDIRNVAVEQEGELVMTGRSDITLPFTVVKVTPVAIAKDGHNYFRVEARLSDENPQLLPGMEGIGKIDAGRRRLGWILFHSMMDWMRLKVWSWLP